MRGLRDIVLVNALDRLVWAAQGVQLMQILGSPENGRTLVATAKAARLFICAIETEMARQTLDDLDKLVALGEDGQVCQMIQRRTADVRKALRWST